jgi:hypothetical protein
MGITSISYLTDGEVSRYLSDNPRVVRFFRDVYTAFASLDRATTGTITDLSGVQADAQQGIAAGQAALALFASLRALADEIRTLPPSYPRPPAPQDATPWLPYSKGHIGLAKVENTALSTWPGSLNLVTLGAAVATSIKTDAPSGAADTWKLGSITAGIGLALNTTSYVEVSVGGTVVKLAQVL